MNETRWPPNIIPNPNEEEVMIKRRKSVVAVSTTKEEKLRFSSYWSNVRVPGWVRRSSTIPN